MSKGVYSHMIQQSFLNKIYTLFTKSPLKWFVPVCCFVLFSTITSFGYNTQYYQSSGGTTIYSYIYFNECVFGLNSYTVNMTQDSDYYTFTINENVSWGGGLRVNTNKIYNTNLGNVFRACILGPSPNMWNYYDYYYEYGTATRTTKSTEYHQIEGSYWHYYLYTYAHGTESSYRTRNYYVMCSPPNISSGHGLMLISGTSLTGPQILGMSSWINPGSKSYSGSYCDISGCSGSISCTVKIKKSEIEYFRYFIPISTAIQYYTSSSTKDTAYAGSVGGAVDLMNYTHCDHEGTCEYLSPTKHHITCSKCLMDGEEDHTFQYEFCGETDSICQCGYIHKIPYTYNYNDNVRDVATASYVGKSNISCLTPAAKTGYTFRDYTIASTKVKDFSNLSETNTETITTTATSSTLPTNTNDQESKVITANWDANHYFIQYSNQNNLNIPVPGTIINSEHVYDTPKALSPHIPIPNYTFKGWTRVPGSKIPEFAAQEEVMNLATETNDVVVLYPIYEIINYQIEYVYWQETATQSIIQSVYTGIPTATPSMTILPLTATYQAWTYLPTNKHVEYSTDVDEYARVYEEPVRVEFMPNDGSLNFYTSDTDIHYMILGHYNQNGEDKIATLSDVIIGQRQDLPVMTTLPLTTPNCYWRYGTTRVNDTLEVDPYVIIQNDVIHLNYYTNGEDLNVYEGDVDHIPVLYNMRLNYKNLGAPQVLKYNDVSIKETSDLPIVNYAPATSSVSYWLEEVDDDYEYYNRAQTRNLVTYMGQTLDFYTAPYGSPLVTWFRDDVTKVELETPPDKTHYLKDEDINLEGMKVKVTYADGCSDIIAYNDFPEHFRIITPPNLHFTAKKRACVIRYLEMADFEITISVTNPSGSVSGVAAVDGYVPEAIMYIDVEESETDDMVLYDDELAHGYSLSNHNKNEEKANSVEVKTSDINHTKPGGSSTTSAKIDITLKDRTNYSAYGSILTPVSSDHFDEPESKTVQKNTTEVVIKKFNEWFNGHRNKVTDKKVLYKGKNSQQVIDELKELIGATEGYVPAKYASGEGNDVFSIIRNIGATLSYVFNCAHCDANGTVHITNREEIKEGNSGDFTMYYELGEANIGQDIPDINVELEPVTYFGKVYREASSAIDRLVTTTKKKFLSFYPYIKMRYSTVQDKTNKIAYLVASNRSKISENITVNVSTEAIKEPTIDLDSQWVSHSGALAALESQGIRDTEALVAGGAQVGLYTKNTNTVEGVNSSTPANNILIESYITCVPDKMIENYYGFTYTESEALEELNKFKESVTSNLENYYIEKWVSRGLTTDENEFNKNAVCVQGYNEVDRFDGKILTKNGLKYYLNPLSKNVNKDAKVDVNIENELLDIYTIKVSIYGDLLFYKNGVYQDCLHKSKFETQFDDKLLMGKGTNNEWYYLNLNTCIVQNVIEATDRNLGESGRYGGYAGWYNEALDGVSIVRQLLDVNLYVQNFKSDVQDPKLTGTLDNKYDMWNINSSDQYSKWRTMQYRLSNRSINPSNGFYNQENYIGELCGNPVYLDDIENVLKSKLFYIGNGSVGNIH